MNMNRRVLSNRWLSPLLRCAAAGAALLAVFVARALPLSAPPDLTGVEFLSKSEDFRVWLNGEEQFVFKSVRTGNHGSHDIASMSFLGFDLKAPVEVKIEPRAKVSSLALRPYNAGINGKQEGNAITFKLDKPQHVVLVVNESYNPVLVLSAKPPHTPPKPADVKHFFGPGVHDVGKHKPLASGDKVYLSEGAIVKGSFAISNASNVSITGRGLIYNGHFPHEEAFRVVKGDTTRDVLIEGVTVCHSPGWIVSFWNGNTNLTVRDVTMVGNWWMNSDGVQTGTKGLLVENCFMQCNDDNFSLNGVCQDVVSLVVEDESGTQQHPAPDAQTLAEGWAKTERRTPIKWGELKRAALRIDSTWGPNGEFLVDECWLSR
jgi:hypothetical protein